MICEIRDSRAFVRVTPSELRDSCVLLWTISEIRDSRAFVRVAPSELRDSRVFSLATLHAHRLKQSTITYMHIRSIEHRCQAV